MDESILEVTLGTGSQGKLMVYLARGPFFKGAAVIIAVGFLRYVPS
ncbi:hypothetical protein ACPOL_4645 [Acidisarcina polymorpha]|uniref:Uncharacterized protein n=1 Tax=Acidisarcina polymorpha TaxID=2211140 RepID=A0A2Z5G5J9_9BACT|nr:hypothetical protein ACPOL_4645 [Acidisarcina polymorpha]